MPNGGAVKWDHPRRCGENAVRAFRIAELWGSPPQVRGKHSLPPRHRRLRRITPAGAGKTVMSLADITSLQDHPRRCGENVEDPNLSAHILGSPPQVRGKHNQFIIPTQHNRITPAGAGKTSCALFRAAFIYGSPPQVRGKRS